MTRRVASVAEVSLLRRRLTSWYERYGRTFPWRARSAGKYERIISELLLQRTRAESVAVFAPRFISMFPNWIALAREPIASLETALRPVGLHARRAASLNALAKVMASRRGKFPNDRRVLEKLPGIGQYIASAIMVIYHGKAEPFLDVNMARVLERNFGRRRLADIRYDTWLQSLAIRFVQSRDPLTTNFAILDFAALICRPVKPKCGSCSLQWTCKMTGVKSSAA